MSQAVGALLAAGILAALRSLLGSEARGWVDRLSRAIIRVAARRLPEPHNARYGEEWLAELEALAERPITRLLYVLRVLLRIFVTRGVLEASDPQAAGFRLMSRRTLSRRLADAELRSATLEGRAQQLATLQIGVLATMVQTLSLRDRTTARHSAATARYARALAEEAGCSVAEQELVHVAGLLHDIGKFTLPDRLLISSQPLDDNDWALIRTHPYQGARLVRRIDGYGPIADIILAHHERIDGRGYPRGLTGDAIPPLARMISIADIFDVLTARDSYRTQLSQAEAVEELRRVSGHQLDGELVEAFVRVVQRLGRQGIVSSAEPDLGQEILSRGVPSLARASEARADPRRNRPRRWRRLLRRIRVR